MSKVKKIVFCISISKVLSEWVSESVSEWQGHLLSCSGQLKMNVMWKRRLSLNVNSAKTFIDYCLTSCSLNMESFSGSWPLVNDHPWLIWRHLGRRRCPHGSVMYLKTERKKPPWEPWPWPWPIWGEGGSFGKEEKASGECDVPKNRNKAPLGASSLLIHFPPLHTYPRSVYMLKPLIFPGNKMQSN